MWHVVCQGGEGYLSNLCQLTAVLEKGKGKVADIPDTDANVDSDSAEGLSNNTRNMTLA